jgi:hypothetical protein
MSTNKFIKGEKMKTQIETMDKDEFFKEVIALAAKYKIGVDNVLQGLKVLELRRLNDIKLQNSDSNDK